MRIIMFKKLITLLLLSLIFNAARADLSILDKDSAFRNDVEKLSTLFTNSLNHEEEEEVVYKHVIESVSSDGYLVTLEDGMSFAVNWWYRSAPKQWKAGDRIFITFDFDSQQFKLEHADRHDNVWSVNKTDPIDIPTVTSMDKNNFSVCELDTQFKYKSTVKKAFKNPIWSIGDEVIILENSPGIYQLWNLDIKRIVKCSLLKNPQKEHKVDLNFEDILNLEDRLNEKVLQQPEATAAVTTALLIYSAGLKKKEQPVGVFLFLGPTGVGKTELAKTLAKEIYNDPMSLIRFDMSHFNECYSSVRLIGSPPGYVNHEEGGQLTEPLRKNSQVVVLLDEMEKAHEQVRKVFLPIFDEGFVLNANNEKIECSDTIFIMTSNLCGEEITELCRLGYETDEILAIIEPYLMEALSPELYNRVEPVLFQPLEKGTMVALVDLFLSRLSDRIWDEKEIILNFDDSLKEYLIDNGYHPMLGARPLNKLIEKKVVATLAYSIIKEGIEDGTVLTLYYNQKTDSVFMIEE